MWDSLFAKVPSKLPKLNVKTENLDTTPIKELTLPSDSDSDCSSALHDPFEEFTRNSFLRPLPGTKGKYLSKQEADWKTVEQFTEDYKRLMKEFRTTSKIEDALTIEFDQQPIHGPEDNAKKSNVGEPILIESEEEDSEATSNSAVWNMIKAHRKEYFATSPPHYDIYHPKSEHYLKRPRVAWQEVEESRKKCEKWLNECETKNFGSKKN